MNWIKKFKIPLLTVFGVLFIDQFIKIYVKLHFFEEEKFSVAGDWFSLTLTENPGMAFGLQFGGNYGKIILSVFRLVASFGGIFYIRHIVKKGEHWGFVLSVSLILAGAIGNILDSAFYGLMFSESEQWSKAVFMPAEGGYAGFLHGKVVDMFHFQFWTGTLPDWFPFWGGREASFFPYVFNFADASISIGVALILIFQKRFIKKQEEITEENKEEKQEPQEQNNLNNNPSA